MQKCLKFFINNTKNINGASIFGYRLKQELLKKGWRWDYFFPAVSYIFSCGFFRPFCKNILRLDGLYFDSENTLGNSEKLNRPIFKAYRKADGIIFQSDFSRTLFENFAGTTYSPQIIIHNGAPLNFSPRGKRINYGYEKTIICSSNWSAVKRLDCIIEGFIEYGNPKFGLIILGWNVEKRIEHPNIKYIGRVAPQDLPVYLRGGDAFIHLSWFDNCPNTVVEALACGLPVLCTHNGGTKEIVRSNGIVIKCEEDYEFKRVAVFKPPRCDKRKIAAGIEQILNWDKPIDADYLRISHVADKYMEFAKRFL